MKLAVGFLTYSDVTVRYLPDFLASLEGALAFLLPAEYQVYAFDNSGPTETQNRLVLEAFNRGEDGQMSGGSSQTQRWPIKYLTQNANLGFSRAYNILISAAIADSAEYFLIINPDTVLAPDAVTMLLSALESNSALAAAAPKILRWDFAGGQVRTAIIDSLGLILQPGLRFRDLGQGEEDKGQFSAALDNGVGAAAILGPTGAAGLFRLSALTAISAVVTNGERKYFDENFFMYKEDCDLAYRLARAGYKSASVPGAVVYHDRTAASAGADLWSILNNRRRKSRQIRAWSFRNQHYLFLKHWETQNFVNRLMIISNIIFFFIFALILEQFLLKEYIHIFRFRKGLTNVK